MFSHNIPSYFRPTIEHGVFLDLRTNQLVRYPPQQLRYPQQPNAQPHMGMQQHTLLNFNNAPMVRHGAPQQFAPQPSMGMPQPNHHHLNAAPVVYQRAQAQPMYQDYHAPRNHLEGCVPNYQMPPHMPTSQELSGWRRISMEEVQIPQAQFRPVPQVQQHRMVQSAPDPFVQFPVQRTPELFSQFPGQQIPQQANFMPLEQDALLQIPQQEYPVVPEDNAPSQPPPQQPQQQDWLFAPGEEIDLEDEEPQEPVAPESLQEPSPPPQPKAPSFLSERVGYLKTQIRAEFHPAAIRLLRTLGNVSRDQRENYSNLFWPSNEAALEDILEMATYSTYFQEIYYHRIAWARVRTEATPEQIEADRVKMEQEKEALRKNCKTKLNKMLSDEVVGQLGNKVGNVNGRKRGKALEDDKEELRQFKKEIENAEEKEAQRMKEREERKAKLAKEKEEKKERKEREDIEGEDRAELEKQEKKEKKRLACAEWRKRKRAGEPPKKRGRPRKVQILDTGGQAKGACSPIFETEDGEDELSRILMAGFAGDDAATPSSATQEEVAQQPFEPVRVSSPTLEGSEENSKIEYSDLVFSAEAELDASMRVRHQTEEEPTQLLTPPITPPEEEKQHVKPAPAVGDSVVKASSPPQEEHEEHANTVLAIDETAVKISSPLQGDVVPKESVAEEYLDDGEVDGLFTDDDVAEDVPPIEQESAEKVSSPPHEETAPAPEDAAELFSAFQTAPPPRDLTDKERDYIDELKGLHTKIKSTSQDLADGQAALARHGTNIFYRDRWLPHVQTLKAARQSLDRELQWLRARKPGSLEVVEVWEERDDGDGWLVVEVFGAKEEGDDDNEDHEEEVSSVVVML